MTKEEIVKVEKKLQEMKNEYMEERPKCENLDCCFHSEIHKNHCSWTTFHDECRHFKEFKES